MQNRLCCALLSLYQRESPVVVAQYFAAQFLIGLLCVDAVSVHPKNTTNAPCTVDLCVVVKSNTYFPDATSTSTS